MTSSTNWDLKWLFATKADHRKAQRMVLILTSMAGYEYDGSYDVDNEHMSSQVSERGFVILPPWLTDFSRRNIPKFKRARPLQKMS